MAERVELDAETAALKSGLGPFYGRILAALERVAAALEPAELATPRAKTRKGDSTDA